MDERDAAVAGIAALFGVVVLLVVAIIVAYRRWNQERREYRRELNQALAGIDVARGHDLEQTQLIVRSHRR